MLSVLEIDKDQDLAYIWLRPDLKDRQSAVAHSTRLADDVVLDFDADNQLIGIELLNASSRIDVERALQEPSNLIVGVKEAAALIGVEKSNFIRDYANKSDFPTPVANVASGRLWLRADVLRHLEQSASSSPHAPTKTPVVVRRPHLSSGLRRVPVVAAEAMPHRALDPGLTARAQLISAHRKERFLLSMSESDLLDRVLKPLFVRQGLTDQADASRHSSLPSCAFFSAPNHLGLEDFYLVLAHKGSLNLVAETVTVVDSLITRIGEALSTRISLPSSQRQLPAKVVFCASGTINDRARDRILRDFGDPRVVLFDQATLVPLIDGKLPELWLDIDANLPPYLSGLKRVLEEFSEETVISLTPGSIPPPVSDQMFVQLRVHRTTFRAEKRRGRIERVPHFEELPINSLLNRKERLILLLGDAGFGKSTCLRRLAYLLADRSLRQDRPTIPILFRAADFIARQPGTLVDFCADLTMKIAATSAPSFYASDLAEGRITLMIDSLDELSDDRVRELLAVRALEFHHSYPKCQIIITSREYAFVRSLESLALFERFRISPISYAQAEKILARVQKARSLPKETAKEILRRLQNTHGMELNPLLVTVFAATSEYSRRDIPANITELFKKFTETMLGRWDAGKGLAQQYHAPLKDFILTRVAFEMHRREVTSISREDFSLMVENELSTRGHKADLDDLLSEILVRSRFFRVGPDYVEFRHLLLQEFFAGRGIPSVDFLGAVISAEWWQRAIVFYFGDNPTNARGLQAVINSVAVRPAPELYRAATTLGLALQASYLVEVRDKTEILRWVIEGLASTKEQFLASGGRPGSLPLTKFVFYYILGRDSVACNFLEDKYHDIIDEVSSSNLSSEEKDVRTFWVIAGLIESGAMEAAEKLMKTFRPADPSLDLAIHLGCFLIQHLRIATPQQQKVAQRMSDSLAHRILPLRNQLLSELRSELLELREGKIEALTEGTEEVKIP